jgi:hypothetical protein
MYYIIRGAPLILSGSVAVYPTQNIQEFRHRKENEDLAFLEKSGHTRETIAIPLCFQSPSGKLKNVLLMQATHTRQYPSHED